MTIPYSKKLYRKELSMGLVFLILGILFVQQEPGNIFKYGFILVSILHLTSGFYRLRIPYLKVENGIITKSRLFSRTIPLDDIERIKIFAGDYILYTSETKLTINSQQVSKLQLAELDELLRSLKKSIEETPTKEYKYS